MSLSFFLSYYTIELGNALVVGTVLGGILGVVLFSAQSASEGLQRVVVGILIGGLLGGGFQAVLLASEAGGGLQVLNPFFGLGPGVSSTSLVNAVTGTLLAALLGGMLMVVTLAPGRALVGALAGAVLGTVAGALAWGIFDFLDVRVPVYLFLLLTAGVLLSFLEVAPFRRR